MNQEFDCRQNFVYTLTFLSKSVKLSRSQDASRNICQTQISSTFLNTSVSDDPGGTASE